MGYDKKGRPEGRPLTWIRKLVVVVLCRANVARLQAFLTLGDVELDDLTLGERLETGSQDSAVVHENILAGLL